MLAATLLCGMAADFPRLERASRRASTRARLGLNWAVRFGVALLQTLTPGAEAGKQQQQAALAFVQAEREGASAEAVAAAQQQAVLLNLKKALTLVGLPPS
jgi:hypothetical protein